MCRCCRLCEHPTANDPHDPCSSGPPDCCCSTPPWDPCCQPHSRSGACQLRSVSPASLGTMHLKAAVMRQTGWKGSCQSSVGSVVAQLYRGLHRMRRPQDISLGYCSQRLLLPGRFQALVHALQSCKQKAPLTNCVNAVTSSQPWCSGHHKATPASFSSLPLAPDPEATPSGPPHIPIPPQTPQLPLPPSPIQHIHPLRPPSPHQPLPQ